MQLTENQRLKFLRKELGFTQLQFAERLGVKQNTISSIEKGINSLTDSFKKSLNAIFNVNIDWLETESGEVFEKENPTLESTNAKISISNPERIELPLISISARASFDYYTFTDDEKIETATVYKTTIKGLRHPVLIDIDGDSMEPQLKSGTRILADQVDQSNWIYTVGVVGVAFSDQFVIKRIKENKSLETNIITLCSDNPLGGEFNVRLSDIKAMWKAVEIVKSKIE